MFYHGFDELTSYCVITLEGWVLWRQGVMRASFGLISKLLNLVCWSDGVVLTIEVMSRKGRHSKSRSLALADGCQDSECQNSTDARACSTKQAGLENTFSVRSWTDSYQDPSSAVDAFTSKTR